MKNTFNNRVYLNEANILLNEGFIKDLFNKFKNNSPDQALKKLKSKEQDIKVLNKKIKNVYRKVYNMNVDKYELDIRNEFDKFKPEIENNIINKKGIAQKSFFKTMLVKILKQFTDPITYIKDINLLNSENIPRVKKSILALGQLIIIQIFVYFVLSTIFGNVPLIGIIMSVISAPIIEEYFKRISIKEKYGNQFIFIFSWTEFILYTLPYILTGDVIVAVHVALIRYMLVLFHFSWFKIQSYFINSLKKPDGTDSKLDFIGYYISTYLHSLWNFLTCMQYV